MFEVCLNPSLKIINSASVKVKSYSMRCLFLIYICFIFICCNNSKNNNFVSENDCKIITISSNYSNQIIRLKNLDGSIWHDFSFEYDDSDGQYDFQNDNFQPFGFHPDYYFLALLVDKKISEKEYIVEINASSRQLWCY